MRSVTRLTLALLLFCSTAPAWAGETGSISGKVTDASGGALPGVVVRVSGAPMPAGRTAATTPAGAYNFQRLLPGEYTVESELQGLGKASRVVTVRVDADSQVDLVLSGSVAATVEAVASAVDQKSTEVGVNYSDTQIRSLPLARSYAGLIQLVPGVGTADGVGVSAAGGSRQDNKYLVDGVNITNPGFGTLNVETNELDIADFNVKKGAISAEFGRTSGIIVNAVTRSGTNDLKGTFRFEAIPDSFIAEPKSGSTATQTIDRYTPSANVGFPILHDKLFGYASARLFYSTRSGQGSTFGPLPDTKTRNQEYFGKVTAYPTPNLLVYGGYRHIPNKATDDFNSLFDAPSATYDVNSTDKVANVVASWFLDANTFVEGKYVHLTNDLTIEAGTAVPFKQSPFNIVNLGANGSYSDPARGFGNSGVYEFARFGDEYKRNEVKLTASRYVDIGPTQHQIKVGGGYEDDDYNLIRETNGWGLIRVNRNSAGTITGYQARYYLQQPKQFGRSRTYSVFLQDTITAGRFSANVGLLLNKDEFAQELLDGRRVTFMKFRFEDQIQPRIGLVYNAELLKGDKVYANWGRYYGLDQKSTSRSFAPARIRQDFGNFNAQGVLTSEQIRGSSAGKFIPPDLQSPYVDELILGYGAAVSREVSFELYGQYRETRDIFEDVPISRPNYFGSFQAKNLPYARRRYRGVTLDVTKRFSHNWSANASYTYSKLSGNFDIDYADIAVFNTSSILEDAPGIWTDEPNRYGRLSQDRPHIFKLFASYEFPFGLSTGGALRIQSGKAWEARGMDGNGSFYRYLESAGSRRLPTQTTFDLLLAYNLKVTSAANVRVEARVLNAFNQQTVTSVDRVQYLDSFVDAPNDAPLFMGPQGTTRPNAGFGNATGYATARRLLLSAIVDF